MGPVTPEHEVISDGAVVWVNAADGTCIGRFARQGVDIHKDLAAQIADGDQCLDCRRHTGDLDADWAYFKAAMARHYGIAVPDDHKPTSFAPWPT